MFNLDRHSFNFECPRCRFWNTALLGQVRRRDIVICRGCKINIQLDDQLNEYRKAAKEIRRMLSNFGSLFSS